ncbi:MAG: orotate phosphoribosyltransferase [alpha proteobacterium HIMB59]|nr:MAG: orotate phosphoribosyltransferase [alpha proteobacterium HIMB59]|tara:strand:+ start:573 stop:1211 length:639 start_codon:yes stop_codon:yes gene_type:complete
MSTVKIKNSRQKIADILLSIGCVNINFKNKFTLTSGKKSPVYVDCRKLVSFPKEREIIINEMSKQIKSKYKNQIVVAGGETAGIPYSSYISQKLKLPMVYIRKKPKGFGKGKIIEGEFKKKSKSVLIEDMATDGGSKIHFINSMRKAELSVRDIFVVFFYDIYPSAKANMKKMRVNLNYLASWKDILEISPNYISMKDHANLKKYLDMISNG